MPTFGFIPNRTKTQEPSNNSQRKNQLTQEEIKNILEQEIQEINASVRQDIICLLYTSPSPRDLSTSRMPSSA